MIVTIEDQLTPSLIESAIQTSQFCGKRSTTLTNAKAGIYSGQDDVLQLPVALHHHHSPPRNPQAVLSDADAIYHLLSDQANFPYDEVQPDLSPEVFRSRVDKWAHATAEGRSAFMVVVVRETDELIGFGGFNSLPRAPALRSSHDSAEELVGDAGLVIDHQSWRKGFATEAFCATMEFSFRTLGCGHFSIDTAKEIETWRAFMKEMGLGGTEDRMDSWRKQGDWEYVYNFDQETSGEAKKGLKTKGRWPL
ncbi:hypothetical protein NKR23_g10849 [Pleurostoma richardsiae]|uniref:N-acetyltransferase domain-containing protein n=1 Tax=Pleurostoma richardsiae TaxID=41990 RepID=A0AA38R4K0_9PEZI|nr:hypothetical protein NKR23_g10849 [Pleurostoma richardsiae]